MLRFLHQQSLYNSLTYSCLQAPQLRHDRPSAPTIALHALQQLSVAVTGEPDREPANRDRTVAPPTVPRFPRFNRGTVEPWSQTVAHGSKVQPRNRGAKPWPTVPRFNRGTVEPNRGPRFNRGTVEPNRGPRVHGSKPWPTVPRFNRGTVEPNRGPRFHGSTSEPWSQIGAHGSTVQPWNRGAKPWPTVPRFNRGTVEPNRGPRFHGSTVEPWKPWTVRFPRFHGHGWRVPVAALLRNPSSRE